LFRPAAQPTHDLLRDQLAAVDLDRMTPLDALALLAKLKKER